MTRRVYRYEIPVDDDGHTAEVDGAAAFAAAAVGEDAVEFWAEHRDAPESNVPHTYRVVGTGHPIPDGYHWVATCPRAEGGLVRHLYVKDYEDRPG